ncbi:unnamed protein product [Paramecium pentaurelia]|uniref:Uncharacterized protein n=1 Tax=Paramecium pentaurelia TaxID=43138 RepID=A0A8S1VHK2_9CILI|nr:unnamed protein product [Paramecium pentaurelia]
MIENNQQQINYFLDHHSQIKLPLTENINIKILGFNYRSSILVLGKSDGKIQIYQFKYDAIKLIKEINSSTSKAYCLLFLKKSNQIIFVNNKIQIYSEIGINRGCYLFQIEGPKPNCLILNKDENLLICGSNDKAIRFWRKNKNQWNFHQKYQISHYGVIISLSLDDSENYLICLSELENSIFICQRNKFTNFWSVFQIIYCKESQALQACFIKDSIFILQLYKGENFKFYHQNQETLYFQPFNPFILDKCNPLQISHRFQLQIIKQRQFLIYRKDNCINILLIKSQNNYEFIKLVTLIDSNFIFRATEDGKYLVIWQQNNSLLLVSLLNEI